MSISSIDTKIVSYLPLLGINEKKSLLEVIKSFMKLKDEPAHSVSIDEYNNELLEALQRVQNGKYTTQEQLEKEISAW